MTDTRRPRVRLPIRPAENADRAEWLRLRESLWPECARDQHLLEMKEFLGNESMTVFVATRHGGTLAGFLEASIRPFAEGCETERVGYVEGWYVDADVRLQGVGRRLVEAAENWARGRGCKEMGSDCLVDNEGSLRAHLAIGYEERERLIHFRKWLRPPPAAAGNDRGADRHPLPRAEFRNRPTSEVGDSLRVGPKSGGRHRA